VGGMGAQRRSKPSQQVASSSLARQFRAAWSARCLANKSKRAFAPPSRFSALQMNNKTTAGGAQQYGSASLPAHLKRHVSDSAFEAAVNEIDAGRYPDMHLVFSGMQSGASAAHPGNVASLRAASGSASVRVYVGSQSAAAVPDKSVALNLDEWRARKLAALQQNRISVILCCCNDGSSPQWKQFESSGIRFAQFERRAAAFCRHKHCLGMLMLLLTIQCPTQLLHLQLILSHFCVGHGHWYAQQLGKVKVFWFIAALESTGVVVLLVLCS
jgi:hypothetical protein